MLIASCIYHTYQGYIVELTADIDLSAKAWQPIGYNFNNYFSGTFDGNGYTISNMNASIDVNAGNITNKPYHTIGLFGMCNGATIMDIVLFHPQLSITNESGYQNDYSSIDGTCVYAGGICGYANNTTITNIVLQQANISAYTGAEAGRAYTGGICGKTSNNSTTLSLIKDCYNRANVLHTGFWLDSGCNIYNSTTSAYAYLH